MRNIFFILLMFIGIVFNGAAQKFSKIDFDSIRIKLSADTSLYNKLVQRMKNMDSTLTHNEFILLYYGQVFSKSYDPYVNPEGKDDFKDNYNGKIYVAALNYFDKIIAKNPFDLDTWYKAAVCYRETGNMLMKKRCFRVFNALLDCIEHSGDGMKCESGFVVTCRNDEYFLISDFDLEYESESQIDKCDVLKLTNQKEETSKPQKFKGKKLYFNNYWSLKKMDDLLKGK